MKYAGKNVEGQRNYDRMWLKHHKTLEAKGSAAAKETPAQKKTPAPKASTNAVKRASSEGTSELQEYFAFQKFVNADEELKSMSPAEQFSNFKKFQAFKKVKLADSEN